MKPKKSKKSEALRLMQTKRYLKNGFTQQDAYKTINATRLAVIVNELRQEGHDIETVMVTEKDHFGHTMQYARYFYRGVA